MPAGRGAPPAARADRAHGVGAHPGPGPRARRVVPGPCRRARAGEAPAPVAGEDAGPERPPWRKGHPGSTCGGSGGPGAAALFARLTLRDPLPLHAGDRVLLRDPGGGRTCSSWARPCWTWPRRRCAGGARPRRPRGNWRAGPIRPARRTCCAGTGCCAPAALAAMGVTGAPEPVAADWVADERVLGRGARTGWPTWWRSTRRATRSSLGLTVEAARAALGLPDRRLAEALAASAPGRDPGRGLPASRRGRLGRTGPGHSGARSGRSRPGPGRRRRQAGPVAAAGPEPRPGCRKIPAGSATPAAGPGAAAAGGPGGAVRPGG